MFKIANKNIIQPKLRIGQPNDQYEQEADATADQVMQMTNVIAPPIQRKCEDCEEESLQMKPLSESITPVIQRQTEEEEEALQMKGFETSGIQMKEEANAELSSKLSHTKGSGSTLSKETNTRMSSAFGADFSNVNIHTGTNAIQMNRSLNARAFTHGSDIYFNQGEYSPNTNEGKHLLAHELTHVVQQNSGGLNIQRSFKDGQQETCGGAITCAGGTHCEEPDNPEDGPFASEEGDIGGAFRLTIHIDTAVNTVHDIDEGSDVGHTYVEFTDPSRARYTYGFYPSPRDRTPDPSGIMGSRTASGCVVHPDQTHVDCIDYSEVFILSPDQYYAALSFVQDFCKSPATYHALTNNCTTWAGEVANTAGQSLPNMRESVHIPIVGSNEVDNPNTLLDSLRERDEEEGIQRKCQDNTNEEIQMSPLQTSTPTNPMIQCAFCDTEVSESADFDSIFDKIANCRFQGNSQTIIQLIPILLDRMQDEDLYRNGQPLMDLLIDMQMIDQAMELLPRMERIWRDLLLSGNPNLPGSSLSSGIGSTPQRLIEAARTLAQNDQHAEAISFLKSAFLLLQVIVAFQSNQLGDPLQESYSNYSSRRGRDVVSITVAYPNLEQAYTQMRSILGMYPQMARQYYIQGNQEAGDQLMGINTTLWFQIQEMEGLIPHGERSQALTMATLRVDRPDGGRGYELWGAEGRREVLNPLPGEPSPDVLNNSQGLWESMSDTADSLYNQETWIARLFRYPEVVQEFGTNVVDVHDQSHRIRLFRAMHQVYQRENVGPTPLTGLIRLIEEYLQHFTHHTGDYNIRDMGQNYLDTEFPRDMIGRVIRDCGVYALTTAYDVFRVAQAENIPVSFRIFTMTDHVVLLISEENESAHFVANNDEIAGPTWESDFQRLVALSYSESEGRDYVAFPTISEDLGSTSDSDARFRRRSWNQYQNATRWGLLPEPQRDGESLSEGERYEAAYRNYYEGQEEFDAGATQINTAINSIQHQLQNSDEDQMEILARFIAPLSQLGQRVSSYFIRYATESRASIGTRSGANTDDWILFELYATPTRGQRHPLVRLARVLLYYQHLGGQLNEVQTRLTNWMCMQRQADPERDARVRSQEFCSQVVNYRDSGFPLNFDY